MAHIMCWMAWACMILMWGPNEILLNTGNREHPDVLALHRFFLSHEYTRSSNIMLEILISPLVCGLTNLKNT